MLCDVDDYSKNPGTAVLLTGDGAGYHNRVGFHSMLERMYKHGWKVEVLAWEDSCNAGMRRWVKDHEVFVSLDKFYASITFLESRLTDGTGARATTPLDMTQRPMLVEQESDHENWDEELC